MESLAQQRIVGVIVAGGLARRMGGGDKGLLSFGPTTMLAEVVRRVRPQVCRLVLNANGDPSRFAAVGLPVVADPVSGTPGPLAGVLAGLRWSAANRPAASHVLTVSSDAPFLPPDLARRLHAALAGGAGRIAIARSAGRVHPVIGLWRVDLAEALETALVAGQRRVLAWVEAHGAVVVDFPLLSVAGETVDPFFNANTPAELDEARRLLELGPA